MTRWQAFRRHLLISVVIAAPLLFLMSWFWYPPPLFLAAGAAKLALTIIGVDVVLGPLLTLTVFKSGKKGLKFDLVMIALLQFAALVYGLSVAVQSRPAYIAVLQGSAVLVHANDLYYATPELEASLPRPPYFGARAVAVQLPETDEERSRLIEEAMQGKPELEYRPERYRPIEGKFEAISAAATRLADLEDAAPGNKETIRAWLDKHGFEHAGELRIIALLTRDRELGVVLDPGTRRVVGLIDIVVP